jgi:leucyl-tRNA synthetase
MLVSNGIPYQKNWREEWVKSRIFNVKSDPTKKKFYLLTPPVRDWEPLSLSESRVFIISDTYARFLRLRGWNVLWGTAHQSSSTNITGLSHRIQINHNDTVSELKKQLLKVVGNEEDLDKLVESFQEPWNIVWFFTRINEETLKALGCSLDWERAFSSSDPDFESVVQIQLDRLRKEGYLQKRTIPTLWCPREKHPLTGQDLMDPQDNELLKLYAIKFTLGEEKLMVSTLRPESIITTTHLWVNPYEEYRKIQVKDETWVIDTLFLKALKMHKIDFKEVGSLSGRSLIGKRVQPPLLKELIMILPATFPKHMGGTGIHLSIPGLNVYDWLGLGQLKADPEIQETIAQEGIDLKKLRIIMHVTMPGYKKFPAKDLTEKEPDLTIEQTDKVRRLTKQLYRDYVNHGVFTETSPLCSGLSVEEAKKIVIEKLEKEGAIIPFFRPSSISNSCQCGETISAIPAEDQWVLEYSNREWQSKVLKSLSSVQSPQSHHLNVLTDVIHKAKDYPIGRRYVLSSPITLDDENWKVDANTVISLYSLFHPVVGSIRTNKVFPEQLTSDFWSYMLTPAEKSSKTSKKIALPEEILQEIKTEFSYWYPVDLLITSREFLINGLPPILFNLNGVVPDHPLYSQVAVVEEIIPSPEQNETDILSVQQAIDKHGTDALRLYITASVGLNRSIQWSNAQLSVMKKTISTIKKIFENAGQYQKITLPANVSEILPYRWILNKVQQTQINSVALLMGHNFRAYCQTAIFGFLKDLQLFLDITSGLPKNEINQVLTCVLNSWVILLNPVLPELTEDLWHKLGRTGFVSQRNWPSVNPEYNDPEAEIMVGIFQQVVEQIGLFLGSTPPKGETLTITLAPKFVYDFYGKHAALIHERNLSAIVKELKKSLTGARQTALNGITKSMNFSNKKDYLNFGTLEEEFHLLKTFKQYLETKFNIKIVINKGKKTEKFPNFHPIPGVPVLTLDQKKPRNPNPQA